MAEDETDHVRLGVRNRFQQALNEHGYGFQYAVLNEAKRLTQIASPYRSPWVFCAAEYPVSIKGTHTRIDFLLFKRSDKSRFFLVCECKRANPAFVHWCFAPTSFTARNSSTTQLISEQVTRRDGNGDVYSYPRPHYPIDPAYGLGFSIKEPLRQGDQQPAGRASSQIEEAVSQVLRGLNGLVELIAEHPRLIEKYDAFSLLPVIFTNARLWVSNIDLAKADIHNGNVDLAAGEFQETDWLWYQYHTSPGIKHSRSERKSEELEHLLHEEYVRTVGIVRPAGMQKFLSQTGDSLFE
jgi:hypothetical protein